MRSNIAVTTVHLTILSRSPVDITECKQLKDHEPSFVTNDTKSITNFINFRPAILYLLNTYLRTWHQIPLSG
jgi:hypothetical protein